MRALVLGGGGFLGRHVAAALARRGHEVTVGSRCGNRGAAFPVRVARFEDLAAPAAWRTLLRDVDAVVNCVGILRERGRATYDAVHHRAPAALAGACAQARIRLVHISALGLAADARSGFIQSKRSGEDALRARGAELHDRAALAARRRRRLRGALDAVGGALAGALRAGRRDGPHRGARCRRCRRCDRAGDRACGRRLARGRDRRARMAHAG